MSVDWTSIARGNIPSAGPVVFWHDVSAETVLAAAEAGFFCFPAASSEEAIISELRYGATADETGIVIGPGEDVFAAAWFSPDPRPIVNLRQARVGRTLRRLARTNARWRTTLNSCFDEVVGRCATERGKSWLSKRLQVSILTLHAHGHAHSLEVWQDDHLIGGTFGFQIGTVFTAESQFTAEPGAGKLAVIDLMIRFAEAGGEIFDMQQDSEHVRNLGATPVPRETYLHALAGARHYQPTMSDIGRSIQYLADWRKAG